MEAQMSPTEAAKAVARIAYKRGYRDGMNHGKSPEDEISEADFEAIFPHEAMNI